ncbi:TPA: hypothetical protein KD885_003857 [Vibrio parahaemolyticus]|nr:hypothetical protein [Vibrio parahaemolyticus]
MDSLKTTQHQLYFPPVILCKSSYIKPQMAFELRKMLIQSLWSLYGTIENTLEEKMLQINALPVENQGKALKFIECSDSITKWVDSLNSESIANLNEQFLQEDFKNIAVFRQVIADVDLFHKDSVFYTDDELSLELRQYVYEMESNVMPIVSTWVFETNQSDRYTLEVQLARWLSDVLPEQLSAIHSAMEAREDIPESLIEYFDWYSDYITNRLKKLEKCRSLSELFQLKPELNEIADLTLSLLRSIEKDMSKSPFYVSSHHRRQLAIIVKMLEEQLIPNIDFKHLHFNEPTNMSLNVCNNFTISKDELEGSVRFVLNEWNSAEDIANEFHDYLIENYDESNIDDIYDYDKSELIEGVHDAVERFEKLGIQEMFITLQHN